MKVTEKIGPDLEQFSARISWKSEDHQFNQRLLEFRKLKPSELAKVKKLQGRKLG